MSDLLLLVLLVFFLWDIKYYKGSNNFYNSMEIEQTTHMRGIAAIGIMLHHLAALSDGFIFSSFNYVGYIITGIFFFYSGYGLREGSKKKGYFVGFFSKRFLKILLPFFSFTIIYLIVKTIMYGVGYISVQLLFDWVTGGLVNNSWYVFTLLIMYLGFYLAYRFIKYKGLALLSLTIFQVIYIILFRYVFHLGLWWVNSCFAFLLGILLADFKKEISNIFQKRYWIWLLAVALAFVFTTLIAKVPLAGNQSPLKILVDQLSVCCFCMLIYIYGMKFKMGNKATKFLGEISYEIYLLHGLIIVCIKTLPINSSILIIALVLLASVLGAYLFHMLFKKVFRFKPIKEKNV